MKRCPECRRDYYDDTMLYCLDDGNQLVYGSARDDAVTELFRDSERRGGTRTEDIARFPSGAERRANFWVSVLPFKYSGSSTEVQNLAEGLAEDIVTALSRFSYLRVIHSSSTARPGEPNPASYTLTGSLRPAGRMLRVTVKLVETETGAHIWAESYDFSSEPDQILNIHDELVPRVVSTVADQYGALVHSMSEFIRDLDMDELSPHEAMLRAFGYQERATPEEHKVVRAALEHVLEAAPNHSNCLAMLSHVYWHEYAYGYNAEPEPLERALSAAQRAVVVAKTNHLAYGVLATVLFLKKDFAASRQAVERSLQLNPIDASTTAFLGILIAYSGDWKYGLALTERAIALNPHHPGWYHFPAFYNAYRERDYELAVTIGLKIDMPGYFVTYANLAAVYGQIGDKERATAAWLELKKLMPDFASMARDVYNKWLDDDLTEHLLDGLRKAGMRSDKC